MLVVFISIASIVVGVVFLYMSHDEEDLPVGGGSLALMKYAYKKPVCLGDALVWMGFSSLGVGLRDWVNPSWLQALIYLLSLLIISFGSRLLAAFLFKKKH